MLWQIFHHKSWSDGVPAVERWIVLFWWPCWQWRDVVYPVSGVSDSVVLCPDAAIFAEDEELCAASPFAVTWVEYGADLDDS